MLRLCVLGVYFALLTGTLSISDSMRTITLFRGQEFTIGVSAVADQSEVIVECILLTPIRDLIVSFNPGDEIDNVKRFEVMDDKDCSVKITDVVAEDRGFWTMTYETETGPGNMTDAVFLIVNEPNISPGDDNDNDKEDDLGTMLDTIQHFVREEDVIDVSLDTSAGEEDCYVRAPGGELTKVAQDFEMDSVIVQASSLLVSCRITIGPINENTLGGWLLCGETNNDMRCQPVTIAWNDPNNPSARPGSSIQPRFEHSVNYGLTVNPGVSSPSGFGAVSCHVVTPNGEDLVITKDTKYRNIARVGFNHLNLCSIKFSITDADSLGDWTIYGRFRASRNLQEIHQPLRFTIYNEDNPYEQAYNVTDLPDFKQVVILKTALTVTLSDISEVDNCVCETPSRKIYNLDNAYELKRLKGVELRVPTGESSCQLIFHSITTDVLGKWRFVGKFSHGNIHTEKRQKVYLIQEDPRNPIVDDFRTVEILSPQIIDTKLETTHRVTIASTSSVENESCHILTPTGLQYAFITGFNVSNVEIVTGSGIDCGVEVHVYNTEMIGDWTLISRAVRRSGTTATHIERRRTFSIHVEEVLAAGNPITITEGSDLYLRLPVTTEMFKTCKLFGPTGEDLNEKQYLIDDIHRESCGYIIQKVNLTQSGTWSIIFGKSIIYRANIQVNVLEPVQIAVQDQQWTVGQAVNMTMGPADAVYCNLYNSRRDTVFDDFGPCRVEIDKVTSDLRGQWLIYVGVPGSIGVRYQKFNVDVLSSDWRPFVTTEVVEAENMVTLSCSVSSNYVVQACKFATPEGHILLANHGVGQGVYAGASRYETDTNSLRCKITLTNPELRTRGIWRCAVHTKDNTGYGFLTYFRGYKPEHTSSSDRNDVTVPFLQSQFPFYSVTEGENTILSCSISAPIRYCYFRSPNGTVFNVGPSLASESYEYVGNGFDSGECGVKFNELGTDHTGTWSCSVGMTNFEERSDAFEVGVSEPIRVFHTWRSGVLEIGAIAGDWKPLDYCRFVRNDGLGFNSINPPPDFYMYQWSIYEGRCILTITEPTGWDLQPWTVFVKVTGETNERSDNTGMLQRPAEANSRASKILFWMLGATMGFLFIVAAVSLIPPKNRKWTYERAASIRNSFRRNPMATQEAVQNDLPPKV
ncbi:uncharacterized protein LOC111348841 [Spodoptera litura]|uniref:Uncharacterized protein LOC111348841 n=1 Tax=Spodoptera litura TaxID=69820 RepID=A0A9J7IIN2_SPOLT|nr:uncharacterized protein LOC111348841 [Spodoptera litura]